MLIIIAKLSILDVCGSPGYVSVNWCNFFSFGIIHLARKQNIPEN